MLFSRFVSIAHDLNALEGHSRDVPHLLIHDTANDTFALLNLDSDFDKIHYFEDPRFSILCQVTAADLMKGLDQLDPVAAQELLSRHAQIVAMPPAFCPFSTFMAAAVHSAAASADPPK